MPTGGATWSGLQPQRGAGRCHAADRNLATSWPKGERCGASVPGPGIHEERALLDVGGGAADDVSRMDAVAAAGDHQEGGADLPEAIPQVESALRARKSDHG